AGEQTLDLATAKRVDRACTGLGLASHHPDPECARRMHPAVVGAGEAIVGFQRTVQGHCTVSDAADIETILCGDQLPAGIDARQRARHAAKLVNLDAAACKPGLEQPSL